MVEAYLQTTKHTSGFLYPLDPLTKSLSILLLVADYSFHNGAVHMGKNKRDETLWNIILSINQDC